MGYQTTSAEKIQLFPLYLQIFSYKDISQSTYISGKVWLHHVLINSLKSAFSNKYIKLIMSDEHSYFSFSILFLYEDSAGGFIKQFFLPIGKYFKENS